MESRPRLLSEISRYRALGQRIATAGQPIQDQFRTIQEAGFDAVINLALPTSDNSLADEGSIVTDLRMLYVHIPVDFHAPVAQDFRAFCRVMMAFDGRQIFVHCATNKRVSVFMFLYRVLYQQVGSAVAERDLHAIWQPNEIWTRFIQQQLELDECRR